jgi:predicted aspartyl protease
MTGRRVPFTDIEQSISGVPRGEVILHGPGGPRGTDATFTDVLIDTGATHTHLPDTVLAPIGLNLQAAVPVTVAVVGGTVTCRQMLVDITIQGLRCKVDVCFGNHSTPLIGRSSLYKLFTTTGFTELDWLRQVPALITDEDDSDDDIADDVAASLRAFVATHRRLGLVIVDDRWVTIGGVRIPRRPVP